MIHTRYVIPERSKYPGAYSNISIVEIDSVIHKYAILLVAKGKNEKRLR